MKMLVPRASINLIHIPLILSLSLLILCKLGSSKSVISSICRGSYNQTNTNQTEDTYQINLQNLLSQFPSRSASLSFYNSTLGLSPDKAYALYLCRGDATSELCHSCITNLTDFVTTDGCYRGWTFNENCMLRYANYSFFGDGDNAVLARDYSEVNATDVGEFNRTVGALVGELITVAAFESDGLLFATKEASVGGDDGKVYGLGQCTPDIGGGNCSVCLKKAYAHLQRCCVGRTYAWAFLSSCRLRYDNSTFYGVVGSSATPANSNAQAAAAATWTLLLFMVNLITLG